MHKNATKCNKTQSKCCINKHGASKIIDTFEKYQPAWDPVAEREQNTRGGNFYRKYKKALKIGRTIEQLHDTTRWQC
jgi:hypothetical protein